MITEFQNALIDLRSAHDAVCRRVDLGQQTGFISPGYYEILEELAEYNKARIAHDKACRALEKAFEAAVRKKHKEYEDHLDSLRHKDTELSGFIDDEAAME